MKIALISDVHLEYNFKNILRNLKDFMPKADVLVCAGDISNPFEYSYQDFLQKARKIYKTVIVIPGNHEYYQTSEALAMTYPKKMSDVETQMRKSCENAGVVFLQKDTVDIDNVRFYGCTLWADPYKSGGEEVWEDRHDYKHISDFEIPEDYRRLHLDHRNWLDEELSRDTSQHKIVVTHHIPSYKLVDSKYTGSVRNGYYVSECDDLLAKAEIWIAGHTHRSICEEIEGARVFCNSIGYPWEESPYKKTIIEI